MKNFFHYMLSLPLACACMTASGQTTRMTLDGDGYCDWYLDTASPMSSGGDRDSINTLYLGGVRGWERTGAAIPANKPDQLGFGKADAEQERYLFGEEPAVIHDAASKSNYIIAALYERNTQRDSRPGYRIFDWDAGKKTLRLLDKWAPGSKAAEVYAFFKAHGARRPAPVSVAAEDSIQLYDPEVEAFELTQACDQENVRPSFSDGGAAVSRHLLARCRHKP